jgi:hypothetical protein
MAGMPAAVAGNDSASRGDSMSSRILRRLYVVVLALALWSLPAASVHAAPRGRDAGSAFESRIQQIGRILLQTIERLVQGPPPPSSTSDPNPTPNASDGVGIDPHGGLPGK